MRNRGYCGIGVFHPKTAENIGTLLRSAMIFGADFVFTIGRRYKQQASDTLKTWRHIPLWNFQDYQDFADHIPYACQVVCVELADTAKDLRTFVHPQQAVYLLGAEDNGLPQSIMEGKTVLTIPSPTNLCLNVSVAGSIVLYDRYVKQGE
jgi:tRNA G18 (ribose-2'-O)-methylase SpoU